MPRRVRSELWLNLNSEDISQLPDPPLGGLSANQWPPAFLASWCLWVSGAMDRSVHNGSPAPEQRGDLPDALPLLHVHPYSFGALTRAQSMAAAERHAARFCRCYACGHALPDQFSLELCDLSH